MAVDVEKYVKKTTYLENVKRLIFGVGSSEKVGEEAKRLGGDSATALLVTDSGVRGAGLIDNIKASIEEKGLTVDVYDKALPEPTMESMKRVAETVRSGKYNVVVGAGGGSVMDAAKTAAITATNSCEVEYYFSFLEDRVKVKPLPKILLPTTSGTGSEVTSFAVATDEKGVKNFITSQSAVADVSIVDPLMTITCPPRQTAGSGVDALSHALESVLTLGATPVSDGFALHAIGLVFKNLRTAYYKGNSIEARNNMALAATLAGLSIVIVPATIGHCISEAIGPMYKIPHGVANAIVTPYQMEYNLSACTERLALVALYAGEDIHGLSTRDAALKAVAAVKNLITDLELPTSLKEAGVPKGDLPKLAEYLVKERQLLYDLPTWNPRRLTMDNVAELLDRMWKGEK